MLTFVIAAGLSFNLAGLSLGWIAGGLLHNDEEGVRGGWKWFVAWTAVGLVATAVVGIAQLP